jgi:hypothetical protein
MSGWLELYPDANDVVGLDFGDEFPRMNRSRRAYRGATAESVAAEDVKLQALRDKLAAMGEKR